MVKNTCGGNRSKSFARKHANHSQTSIRLPDNPLEVIAVVFSVLGHGNAIVKLNSTQQFICHIRRKFSGRLLKMNFISKGSIVLVGLRHWETEPKNVDLIEVYNPSEVSQLRKLPNLDFRPIDEVILSMGGNGSLSHVDSSHDIEFSNDLSTEEPTNTTTTVNHDTLSTSILSLNNDSFSFDDI